MAGYFWHLSCLFDLGTPGNAAHALDLYNDPCSDGFLLSLGPAHKGPWARVRFRSDLQSP